MAYQGLLFRTLVQPVAMRKKRLGMLPKLVRGGAETLERVFEVLSLRAALRPEPERGLPICVSKLIGIPYSVCPPCFWSNYATLRNYYTFSGCHMPA